ncbi:fatty acid desaturase [Arcobacter aquimarinus]|uniref:Fatty acid desaturase n=1 Tax=Arcobacter aquimarinus TaxID=1315211 RepID=A0AAE7B4R5_9BACT|nr:fatty acid desaturase [Arcobacter aquimarinus]QKE27076.1 fatty acid desaturase [Arcobacter aquimarinus]
MNKIQWIKPELDNFDKFKLKSDIKGSFHIIFYFTLLGSTGYLTHYFFLNNSYYLAFVLLIIHGTFFSFLGWSGIGHELVHRTVFKTTWLNEFFLKLFSFLTWNNYIYFEESHKRHHLYTLHDNLDREVILPLSPEYNQWIYLFTFNIPFFLRNLKSIVYNSFGKISGVWGNELFPKEDLNKRQKLFNFARIILFGHIFLALIFIFTKNYECLLIITFAPFIGNWLNRMMAISQHINMQKNINDFRKNSTSIRLNWFLSMLYSNMNYHIEHHLYPNVPFYNLPILSKEINHFLPTPIVGFSDLMKHIFK